MKNKIIVFSLYGQNEIYTHGAIENAKIALKLFPDWTCRFYVANDVDQMIVEQLKELYCDVRSRPENIGISGMFWRFEPLFEHDTIMLSRDADSRLSLREKCAVDEWLKSDFDFHIIRDHPSHAAKIMGGMFGSKNHKNINKAQKLMSSFKRTASYGDDQFFLSRIIYPIIKKNVLIHSSGVYYDNEKTNSIKIPKTDHLFIGKSYRNNARVNEHIDEPKHLHSTKKERIQVLYFRLLKHYKNLF